MNKRERVTAAICCRPRNDPESHTLVKGQSPGILFIAVHGVNAVSSKGVLHHLRADTAAKTRRVEEKHFDLPCFQPHKADRPLRMGNKQR